MLYGRETYLRENTICAPFTPAGRGSMSAIRVSGPDAFSVCDKLLIPASIEDYAARELTVAKIRDEDRIIDKLLIAKFPAPESFTGEDVVEFHLHGSPFIVSTVIALLVRNGASEALPGEFSFRATLNGKMDLTQAEGLADLINSKTDAQHKAAMSHLGGKLKEHIRALRSSLIRLLAGLEVTFDHPGDVVEVESVDIGSGIVDILEDIRRLTASFERGRLVRDGIRLGIFGRTNVGKSSLLNLMVGRERAIVTDEPGTTRDVIEAPVELFGMEVKFVDTAGLRRGSSDIEALGQEKTREEMEGADIRLIVLDGSCEINDDDREVLALLSGGNELIVVNKSDLSREINQGEIAEIVGDVKQVSLSCKSGAGYEELLVTLKSLLFESEETFGDVIITSSRQHSALRDAEALLNAAREAQNSGIPEDMVALELRAAVEKLETITGGRIEDDLYSTIFSEFCIGK